MAKARRTAINLLWAVERILAVADADADADAAGRILALVSA